MCFRQQTVRTHDIDNERWVEKEVLHSVFLHPSISRMEEDQYQAFFRYVSTKEYPAVVDMCLWRRLLLISCRQILHYMNTQIQEGGNDCGLFAIATACHYIMPWGGPSWLGVSISRVRCEVTSRLLRAIAMKTILLFPSKAPRKRRRSCDRIQRQS